MNFNNNVNLKTLSLTPLCYSKSVHALSYHSVIVAPVTVCLGPSPHTAPSTFEVLEAVAVLLTLMPFRFFRRHSAWDNVRAQ